MKGKRSILGLDVGHYSVKAVLAVPQSGKRMRVLKAETIPVPPGLPSPAKPIQRWIEENELQGTPVVLSISGSRVLYQTLTREEGDPRTPDQIAAIEAMRFREMTDSVMLHTATPASLDEREPHMLISFVRPDLLNLSLAALEESGTKLVNCVPAPVALYNGVRAIGEPVKGVIAVAHVGATNTEVVIGDGRGVLFARSFSLGTALLTNAFASALGVTPQEAERQRLEAMDIEQLPAEGKTAVDQFTRRWQEEVQSCIDMYRSQVDADRSVERIMLSGGGVRWDPLRQQLLSATGLPAAMVGNLPGQEHTQSAEYIIAAGLAASGLNLAVAPGSLLPEEIRGSLVRERNKQYWLLTGIFSVAAMGVFVVSLNMGMAREREYLTNYNSQLERCKASAKQIEAMQKRLDTINEMTQPLIRFVNNSARVRDLTLFIGENLASDAFITLIADSESYIRQREETYEAFRTKKDGPRPRRPALYRDRQQSTQAEIARLRNARMNLLIVEGFSTGPGYFGVRDLIRMLEKREEVEAVDLMTDDLIIEDDFTDPQWLSTGGRKFVVRIQLKDPTADMTKSKNRNPGRR